MSTKDKKFNDFDALMVYLNEADEQKLTDKMLSSPEGCEQLESLQKDMNTIEDKINDYYIDDEYGHDLWNKISDKLDKSSKLTWFQKLIRNIQLQKLSAVGLVAMFAIASTFYLLGQKQATEAINTQQASSQQLLAQNMQLHLAQTDMFLTQVSNMNNQQSSPVLIQTAESLLATNRIYKNAYINNNNKRLKSLLSELEQVLLEISNGENTNSQKYIRDYASTELLYKVKSNNQKLKSQLSKQNSTSSI
jgi:hypothetical protein